MLIIFGPFVILGIIGLFSYRFFDFGFKSIEKRVFLVMGMCLILIPSVIYSAVIADKIGQKFPTYEAITEQKSFPECGIIIEKRLKKFKDWRHSLIAFVPSPEVREVCRRIE